MTEIEKRWLAFQARSLRTHGQSAGRAAHPASQRLAPLIHARGQAAVQAQGPALVRAVERSAGAGRQPFCHIPQEIVSLLRQEAIPRVGLDGSYRTSPSSFDPACLT
jgi:hypothetical protein